MDINTDAINDYGINVEKKKWQFDAHIGRTNCSPVVSKGVVYVLNNHGHLYAVDIKTGEERWNYMTNKSFEVNFDDSSYQITVSGEVVCFSIGDNHLYTIDIKSAEQLAPAKKKEEQKKQEEADKHGIIEEDIRTKYISGEITLEEGIELQAQHLKNEEDKRKEEDG